MPNEFEDVYEGIIRELYQRAADVEGPHPEVRNYLLGPDNKFLGKLTSNRFDPNGIYNQFGPFGSKYSSNSIFNRYGPFGSVYSSTSPWNRYAGSPPQIFVDNRHVGALTKNRFVPGARDPDEFLESIRTDPGFRY
jgi:hypothetical protein